MKTNIALSSDCKSIILGSLLGDGSLKVYPNYQNARFAFRHSDVQREYFDWKASQLREISSGKCIWRQSPSKGEFGTSDKWRFQSKALPALTEVFNLVTDEGVFKIKDDWLEYLNPLSLMVWWMDDGSLIAYGGRKGVLCTDGFAIEDVEILSRYLTTKWGIKNVVAPKSKDRPEQVRIWIRSTVETQKFLRIILPHLPSSTMLSKFLPLYHDSALQQRWISEVADLTKFSVKDIEAAVAEKKLRWSMFSQKKI